jgi:hypothetical protein
MARIRSIHPGLFTDEAFMSASPHARLLVIGIWCEAWDDGVFEWKPLTLKARLFPVDNVDVVALLNELEALDFLKYFDVKGKAYGAIRNFCKWQRPKSPNSSGALTEHMRSYVALSGSISETLPNHSGNTSEKSPQMEDGGDNRKGEEKKESSLRSDSATEPKAPKPEKQKRAKARTQISEDTQPSEKDRASSAEVGMAPETFRHEWQKFRDHHLKVGSQMADWPAAWRTWAHGWLDRGGKQFAGQAPTSALALVSSGHYAKPETPQWEAWAEWWRMTKGKSMPRDAVGGWHVPSEWPPNHAEAAA